MKPIRQILILTFFVGAFAVPLAAQSKTDSKTSFDPRVAKAFAEMKIEYTVKPDGTFSVIYGVGDKRKQTAYVLSDTDNIYGIEMRSVFSYAAFSKTFFSQEITRQLLDENMENTSAWAVIKTKNDFCLVNVIFIPADADAKRLDAAITAVVVQADKMEAKLAKGDEL